MTLLRTVGELQAELSRVGDAVLMPPSVIDSNPSLHVRSATLAEQIAAAKPGDVVTVTAGVHTDPLPPIPGGVTIIGQPGSIIDGGGRGSGILIVGRDGGSLITIEGVEIRHVVKGINVIKGGSDIVVRGCRVHDCSGSGIWCRDSSGLTVDQCDVTKNKYGIQFHHASGCVVTESTVTRNQYDGITISHSSSDIGILNNVIRHHTDRGHPDGIQTHNGCTKIRISGNLIFENGQAMHTQATDDIEISGNLILGTLASALVMGKGAISPTTNGRIHHNVIAYTGHLGTVLTSDHHDFSDNVCVTGGGKGCLSYRNATEITGDLNTYWGTNRQDKTLLLANDAGFWNTDEFAAYQRSTEIDQNSVCQSPAWPSAPIASTTVDMGRIMSATESAIPVVNADLITEGDMIEIGMDGILRRAVIVWTNVVTIEPALPSAPTHGMTVMIWGDRARCWYLGEEWASLTEKLNSPGIA